MIIRRHSNEYNFIGDTETGTTFRWGKTLNHDPLYAPWPELADISISNHCSKNCTYCYRNSMPNKNFMSIDDYDFVLASLQHPKMGNVFQVALGGGEPLEHPDFIDIIKVTNKHGVVPNFTTNGLLINDSLISKIERNIGAVAVSSNDINLLKETNTKLLMESNIKTNIHYILNKQSLGQAIDILKGNYNNVLSGINGIVFLTYKPTGRATENNCLEMDTNLIQFIKLIEKNECNIRIGFDACFIPILLHFTNTRVDFIDSCECAYFSVYIDESLNIKPCSFSDDSNYSFSLKEYTFEQIWKDKFSKYRALNVSDCMRICKNKAACRGRCSFFEQINLCYTSKKEEAIKL